MKLNILAHIHSYPPYFNAGGEWMFHTILRWMANRGHSAKVLTAANMLRGERAGILDGVEILCGWDDPDLIHLLYSRADVVMTHLDCARSSVKLCQQYGNPSVHIIHTPWYLNHFKLTEQEVDLAVFNAEWLYNELNNWGGPKTICRPPVFSQDYVVDSSREYITLLNLNENKGGKLFWKLARAMPDHKFLAVEGAYDRQVVHSPPPPNVKYVLHSQNVREIYEQTRILIVPSKFESFGRVALEAAASGIPVVCSSTPGLKEAMADCALYCEPDRLDQWIGTLKFLDQPDQYKTMSTRAQQRAFIWSEQVFPKDLLRLESCLQAVTSGPKVYWNSRESLPAWFTRMAPRFRGGVVGASDPLFCDLPVVPSVDRLKHRLGGAVVLSDYLVPRDPKSTVVHLATNSPRDEIIAQLNRVYQLDSEISTVVGKKTMDQ